MDRALAALELWDRTPGAPHLIAAGELRLPNMTTLPQLLPSPTAELLGGFQFCIISEYQSSRNLCANIVLPAHFLQSRVPGSAGTGFLSVALALALVLRDRFEFPAGPHLSLLSSLLTKFQSNFF